MRKHNFALAHPALEVLETRELLSSDLTGNLILSLKPGIPAAVGDSAQIAVAGGALLQPLSIANVFEVQGAGNHAADLMQRFAAEPYVNYVEPDYLVHEALTPNDPKFLDGTLWGLNGANGIQAPAAWDVITDSSKVVIADIDTGMDYNHPDLYQNVWINQAEIPASRLGHLTDFDGDGVIGFDDLNDPRNQGKFKISDVNGDGRIDAADILAPMVVGPGGYDMGLGGWVNPQQPNTQDGDTAHPDDLIGWNFVANNNNPLDDNGHGTHTAGTLGAVGNDGVGIVGVNWQAQIMPLKFLDSTGSGTDAAAAQAIEYAAKHGARVSSNSWDGGGNSTTLSNAIQDAGNAGQIFVAAAGNSSQNNDTTPIYPATFNLPNIVSVAAIDSTGALASFSDYGTQTVHLGAPGVSIYSTLPNANYGYLSGTSMATAHVAGTLALMLANNPTYTVTKAINQLLGTTKPDAALAGITVSNGIVNAALAVQTPTMDLNWTGGGITGPTPVPPTFTPFTVSRTYAVSDGTAPADFTISYYASTSSDLHQNLALAQLLGTETISAAADKAVGSHTGTSSSLQFTKRGAYYILAKLNSGNAFVEEDETNNVAVTPQQINVGGAIIIDDLQPGYSETGTWVSATGQPHYGADLRYSPAGGGENTATWQAGGLASGKYDVQMTWSAWPNQATNAPFQVYDGTTLLATVAINQKVDPLGVTVSNSVFQSLGAYSITSGTVKVVLSNKANGYVIADAMRVATPPNTTVDLNWAGGSLTGPATTDTQSTFTISRTYNISGGPVPSDFTIGYYASQDTNIADGVLLGRESITSDSGKSTGTHAGTSQAFRLSNGGKYYLFARLDDTNAITETDKTNNVAQTAQQTAVALVTPYILDNGQFGYLETGTWVTATGQGHYGPDLRYSAPGGGENTATWQVGGLASGKYDVQMTWSGWPNQATNAPFQIYDGTTLLATVAVNQKVDPAGTSIGSSVFRSLGNFTIASGTLKVVLSNKANGYVIADALRVATPAATTLDLNWTGGSLTGPATTDTQSTFTISRTYNVSNGPVPADFTIGYYASLDINIADGILLGRETITASADKSTGTHAGTSPAFQLTNGGNYYLFARLDDSNAIAETDKNNNVAQTAQPTLVATLTPYILDNGQVGYSEKGTWVTATGQAHYGPDLRYSAAGGGENTATWQVGGLVLGYYDLQMTWSAWPNQATNAPYRIYDGTTLLATVAVNQKVDPVGATVSSSVFQTLGTFGITSGTIKVVLSNNANGYVIADALRLVKSLPSTANGISVFSDQLPNGLSDSLVHFAATHYVGTQKMTLDQTNRFRALNPLWVQLHYRLATESGPVQYITNNAWGSDWASVTSHEDWFMHNASNQRLHNSASNWDLHDITNPAWRQYWVNSVIADMRAEGSQGVFADSFEAGVGSFWFDQYDVRFAGTNAGNPAYWPNGMTWMDLRKQLIDYVEAALAATPEHFQYIPNIDAQVTSWENMDYSHIDGAMLEDFGDWGGGYLKGGDPSNWTLSMNRGLALSKLDKDLIMQPTLFDQPDAGNSPLQREFLMGTYLLLKGNHTYINILSPHTTVSAFYFPEYGINMGPAITPLATDVSQYLWNGVYRRDFQNGIVLVNPTNSTMIINLGQPYNQVTGTGGGILTDSSLDASGNYIGGALNLQAAPQVRLLPGSAAILLNA